jgi:hypothetical protein
MSRKGTRAESERKTVNVQLMPRILNDPPGTTLSASCGKGKFPKYTREPNKEFNAAAGTWMYL